jgi:hypothetical protein
MFIITFGCGSLALQFVYKTKESADKAYATKADEQGRILVSDDYGQHGAFSKEHLICVVFEDTSLSKQAHVDRSLIRDRTQAAYQKAAEADPVLRMSMRGGPAMIQPMFNGRNN